MEDDKLITLAIHTYEKAQIIKGILESEGIPVVIQNVNLVQPVVSSGVRIRKRPSSCIGNSGAISDFRKRDGSKGRSC